jgi:hypothetical protein
MTVTLGPKRAGSGKMRGGAGYEGLPRHGTDFTAVASEPHPISSRFCAPGFLIGRFADPLNPGAAVG